MPSVVLLRLQTAPHQIQTIDRRRCGRSPCTIAYVTGMTTSTVRACCPARTRSMRAVSPAHPSGSRLRVCRARRAVISSAHSSRSRSRFCRAHRAAITAAHSSRRRIARGGIFYARHRMFNCNTEQLYSPRPSTTTNSSRCGRDSAKIDFSGRLPLANTRLENNGF